LVKIKEIDFGAHGFREQFDIQEWICKTPAVLEPGLLMVAKEQACFQGTNERPDLIALDRSGDVVVIELKRDDSGADVQWQAIKYASYWAKFDFEQIVAQYALYLARNQPDLGTASPEERTEWARQNILDHVAPLEPGRINTRQRIILASHRFAREAVTAVEWLTERHGLKIKCMEITPFHDEDTGHFYLQSSTLLPVEGIEELLVKPTDVGAVPSRGEPQTRQGRDDDEVTRFCLRLRDELFADPRLSAAMRPARSSRWAGTDYRWRYFMLWHETAPWANWQFCYRLWLFNDQPGNAGNRNKCLVSFQLDYWYLKQIGMAESVIQRLMDDLRGLSSSEDSFGFQEWEQGFGLIRLQDYDKSLPDSLREELREAMLWLILHAHGPIAAAIRRLEA
jgi:hypothetical protein